MGAYLGDWCYGSLLRGFVFWEPDFVQGVHFEN